MPKISIIVPVYKVEEYLCRCLDSIVEQTFIDWECIVVDDGSPDNSGKICDEYAEKDERFKVIHKPNEGVAKARLTGFNNAIGDYVVFVDSDDYITEDALSVMINMMKCNDVDIVVCSYYRVINGNNLIDKRPIIGFYDEKMFQSVKKVNLLFDDKYQKAGIPFMLWGKMYKRTILHNSLESCIDYWYGEDVVLWFTIINKIKSIIISEKPVYYYFMHESEAIKKDFSIIWPAYEKLWKYIENYDNGTFTAQLSSRIYYFSKKHIRSFIEKNYSFSTFKNNISTIISSPFIVKYVFNKQNKITGFNNLLFLRLLRNKSFLVLYFLLKIKHLMNNFH